MLVTPLHSEWLPTREAASRLGIHRRTLQRRARAGHIESRQRDGVAEYRVPNPPEPRGVGALPRVATPPPATPVATPSHSAAELATLRGLLDDAIAARVDAERRASVAEYRAAIAETDPAVVEGLRASIAEAHAELARMTAERDEAKAAVARLDAAMRKRYQLIRRLAARISS